MTPSEPFVHLHTHSEYSILDSSCHISDLIRKTSEFGMDALAVTDHGSMGGTIKFYRAAKRAGIKPILGCEVYVAPESRFQRSASAGQRFYHLVLLAMNSVGYENLLALSTRGYVEGFYYRPRVDRELLAEHNDGLIALSACQSGEVPRLLLAGQTDKARDAAIRYADIFSDDRFFIELQDHATDRDKQLLQTLPTLARELGLPLVATNDSHYLAPEDALAHEVLLNIRANKRLDDPDRMRFDGSGYHFRSPKEMAQVFATFPDALENTRKIADRCSVDIEFGKTLLPPFELPASAENADDYLRVLAEQGVDRLYDPVTSEVRERLEYELSVIRRMGYSTYFLIVWDFVRFANEQGVPVGPGRGSAAGSLVAYALGITKIDPIRYNVTFERFLNPDRISMPDVDMDFCIRGRDHVIQYVRDRYGSEGWDKKTAQIATYDRMAARTVIRDVGRVTGTPYATTDRLAKLVPYGLKLKPALEQVPELRQMQESDPEVQRILEIGVRLEGLIRNTSTHAAGVVISPDPLAKRAPLLRLSDGSFVTQFDMVDLEAIGLLKFDFLGLRNLTIIDDTLSSIAASSPDHGRLDLDKLPLDDAATFGMIREGHTSGVFQLEGGGMTALIKRVQPNRFEDLIALLALFRPGPLESGMTEDYVQRRHGLQAVTYVDPRLEPILRETYGLPIYQDQVMRMAQILAGFTLAEADTLRKAMGKKDKAIMASLREKFIAGSLENGLTEAKATEVFEGLDKFSRYGFNKSHTTAYAFISYWTAYLKANYTSHYMASLLGSVQSDTDKIAEYIHECRSRGIEVLPPDINESQRDFTAVDEHTIRFGLGAVKHVGNAAVDSILAVRSSPFRSLFEMCRRIADATVDRETLEALIKAGAFDSLDGSRRGLLLRLSEALEMMQLARHEQASGQVSFFEQLHPDAQDPPITEEEFPAEELLRLEKEYLGLFLSGNPLEQHRHHLGIYCSPISDLAGLSDQQQMLVGGRVAAVRRIVTKRGDPMAFLTLDDGCGSCEITVFPRVLEAAPDALEEDQLLAVRVSGHQRNGDVDLIAEQILPLDQVAQCVDVSVRFTLDLDVVEHNMLRAIRKLIEAHHGQAPVVVSIRDSLGAIDVRAGEHLSAEITPEFLDQARQLIGEDSVRILRQCHT